MTLAISASSPAGVSGNAATLTTAAFTPPLGSIILVSVTNGPGGQDSTVFPLITLTGSTSAWTPVVDAWNTWHTAKVSMYWATVTSSVSTTLRYTVDYATYLSMKTYVITGANTTNPVGANGFNALWATGPVSYTATAIGSIGFLAACYDATIAISAATVDATVGTPAFSRIVHQTTPAAGLTTQTFTETFVAGSTDAPIGWVEILPDAATATVAPPTQVSHQAIAWSTTTTPATLSVTVQAGDIIVVTGLTGEDIQTLTTPTGGGLTYTLRQSVVATGYCGTYLWTAPAPTAQTFTMSVGRAGGTNQWGFEVSVWRGSDGVGASAKSNATNGAPTLTLTTVGDNSAVAVTNGDYVPVDGVSRVWRLTPVEQSYFLGTYYCSYTAAHTNMGAAGAKVVGLSAPAGQTYSLLVVEILGHTTVTVPVVLTGWWGVPMTITTVAQGSTPLPLSYFGSHVTGPNDATIWPSWNPTAMRLLNSWGLSPTTGDYSTSLDWPGLNTSNGVYDWGLFDMTLNKHKAKGVTDLIYTLNWVPTWAGGGASKNLPPSSMAYLTTFINAVAARAVSLGMPIKYWEVWNEPNTVGGAGQSWAGTTAQMVTIAQTVYAAVHAFDSTYRVLSPACQGYSTAWTDGFLAANGGQWCDIMAFHGYTDASSAPEKLASLLSMYKTTYATYGQSAKPIWDTECMDLRNLGPASEAISLAVMYAIQASSVDRFYWYTWDVDFGAEWSSGGGVNAVGVANATVVGWLVGATAFPPVTAGTVWTVDMTKAGVPSRIVWDPASASAYPTTFTSQTTIAGVTTAVVAGSVTLSTSPILLT